MTQIYSYSKVSYINNRNYWKYSLLSDPFIKKLQASFQKLEIIKNIFFQTKQNRFKYWNYFIIYTTVFIKSTFFLDCKQLSAILLQIFLTLNNCVFFFVLCVYVCLFLSRVEPTKLYNCESLKNIEIKIDAYCLLKIEWIQLKVLGKLLQDYIMLYLTHKYW